MTGGSGKIQVMSGFDTLMIIILVAVLSSISGGYLGYKYAVVSRASSAADNIRKDKLTAVLYEFENHLSIIDPEKEREELERNSFFSGQELINSVLENFIFSGAYVGMKDTVLSKRLIYLNQSYSKLKSSKERFDNYVWRLGNNSLESKKTRIEIGNTLINDREMIKRLIQSIIPRIHREIELH